LFLIAQRKLILLTAAVVIGLGAVSLATLLQPPKTVARSQKAPHLPSKVLVANPVAEKRGPAAAQAAAFSDEALQAKNQAVDLTIACRGPQEAQLAPGVTLVRLAGTTCTKKSAIAASEIVNDANGVSATVFTLRETSFTTDYIAVVPGINRIRIAHTLKSGEREEREYLIDRTKL
jgi:hypothetical protein